MKNRLVLFLACFIAYSSLVAQDFEGIITYQITYDFIPQELKDIEDNLPSESTIFIKDGLIKEIKKSGSHKKVTLKDCSTGDYAVLFDLFGQKLAMRMSDEEKEKSTTKNKNINIRYKRKSKNILGYKCKTAIISYPEMPNSKYKITYSDYFGIEDSFQFSSLKGYPLAYEMEVQGLRMTLIAKNISKQTLQHFEFDIPDEYTKITSNEIKDIFSLTGM